MRLLIATLTSTSIQSVSIAMNAASDAADVATDIETCARLLRGGGYDLVLLITGQGGVPARDAVERLRREAAHVPMVVLTEPGPQTVKLSRQGETHAPGRTVTTGPAIVPGRSWHPDMVAPQLRPGAEVDQWLLRQAVRLEPDGETLRAGDRSVVLSQAESRIFARLWDHRGGIVSADDLMTALYGESERPASRVLPVFLFKLRRKLAALGFEDLIETAVGRGFLIRADAHDHARAPLAPSDI